MACFRIFLCSGLAALALVPANLAGVSWPAGLHLDVFAAVQDRAVADESVTSAMLLGGAVILMVAGRRRRV